MMNVSITKTNKQRTARASIIIPAYNEGSVIGRCLTALLSDAAPGEFDVIVVCNGCRDDTEAVARNFERGIRVFSMNEASKTAALNFGDRLATTFPRVYLDADLQIETDSVRHLIDALTDRNMASIGFMDVDLSACSWPVRTFYKIWTRHPYLQHGKFGGIYALSHNGFLRRGSYPCIVADDAFVRECFLPEEYVAVTSCVFRVFPPHTIRALIHVRSRVYLGNMQLRHSEYRPSNDPQNSSIKWLTLVARQPGDWLGLCLYFAVNLVAKPRAAWLHRLSSYKWLRDESSRTSVQSQDQ